MKASGAGYGVGRVGGDGDGNVRGYDPGALLGFEVLGDPVGTIPGELQVESGGTIVVRTVGGTLAMSKRITKRVRIMAMRGAKRRVESCYLCKKAVCTRSVATS